MGDWNPAARQQPNEQYTPEAAPPAPSLVPQAQAAAHNQFVYPSQRQPVHDEYRALNMGSMAGALPSAAQMNSLPSPQLDGAAPSVLSPASVYHMRHAAQFPQHSVAQHDPSIYHPQHYHMGSPMYSQAPMQPYMMNRPPGHAIQPHAHLLPLYGYTMAGVPQYSPLESRFKQMASDSGGFPRHGLESGPVPSYPRGPPRKPKQSGHALWVGNLPPAANVVDLKDHFSRDATQDIESLFLISKSNCAFVNYRTESACIAAMHRFHDSRFHGVRLVCRLRRGSANSLDSPNTPESPTSPASRPAQRPGEASAPSPSNPLIVGQKKPEEAVDGVTDGESASNTAEKVPEKYFIVKSLTALDLEASVRNSIWATQSHNEQMLNRAYDESENVYLIFSANKSGEYFGYARMASKISGELVNVGTSPESNENKTSGTPQAIPTSPTETAPRGRIIDDSARGTIFWEAERSEEDEAPAAKDSGEGDEQNWGRQFKIEWISTSRLPFFRTRGLRNPWNANREVKIARDGTELEPSIGRRLVQMFHRPPPPPSQGPAVTGRMPMPGVNRTAAFMYRQAAESHQKWGSAPWGDFGMARNWQQASA